jgi:hypothetical protein
LTAFAAWLPVAELEAANSVTRPVPNNYVEIIVAHPAAIIIARHAFRFRIAQHCQCNITIPLSFVIRRQAAPLRLPAAAAECFAVTQQGMC